ncbi:MAG TPA: ATP-binding protein [Chroococcidiopsis sp.]
MLFDRFLLLNQTSSGKRFKLLRNFSIVSLSTFILATLWLAVFYRQRAIHDLIILSEENNVALTQVFSNTLWPKYGTFLSSTQTIPKQTLAADPRIRQLYQDMLDQFEGLHVVKVKFFDLQGRTVFSTELSQIGNDYSQESGFLTARSGTIVSQLEHRDSFNALETTIKNRQLLSSYIPVREAGAKGKIVGVFELYTDVTPLLEHVHSTQRAIVLGSLLSLAALYSILYLFVRRADHLLEKQYQQLQESEGRYRQQASELEQTLSELQQTQTQILQSEKMSSLGQLVAGVAHEINNPVSFIHGNLTYVQNYAQNLLKLVQSYQRHYPNPVDEIRAETEAIDLTFIQEDLPKTLDSMTVGSDRIREIVLALRIFSRLNEAEIKPVDIHKGIESTLLILQHRLKACPERPEIEVIREYGSLPLVECYSGLLNQVFMNILSNAIDALEEEAKKRTYQECLERPWQIKLRTSLLNDQWVQMAIADNGPGIPQPVQQRIFDPFFTTKPIGKGTGLGMSISYQIITERHGGILSCVSTPNQGTEFVIQIPIQQSVGNANSASNVN